LFGGCGVSSRSLFGETSFVSCGVTVSEIEFGEIAVDGPLSNTRGEDAREATSFSDSEFSSPV